MNVGTICSRNIATVCAHEPLADAARLLCDQEAIVAIASPAAQPTVLGIITAQDILRGLLMQHCDLWHLKVIDVLSRTPLVLNEDDEIGAALLQLNSRGLCYAPVVGSGGTLHGAVSRHTLSTFTNSGSNASASTL